MGRKRMWRKKMKKMKKMKVKWGVRNQMIKESRIRMRKK
jgi:hypothetical protein